jgi:hypothetical protein
VNQGGYKVGQKRSNILTRKRGIEWVNDNVIKVSFGKKKVQEKEIDLDKYLAENDYSSIEEWAMDSDYRYDKNTDIWYDEEGNGVNIAEKLWYVIDSLTEEE